jgi:hypothetical protein
MGRVTTAVLDDTCGNLIQIAHRASQPGPARVTPVTPSG